MSIESKSDEYLWVEKYRPRKIDDCIFPDKFKQQFKDFVVSGQIPHLLLAGGAGMGKCLHPDEEIDLLVSDEIYEKLKMLS